MPLSDYIPKLDDRTYGDIMSEVRTRIARYTPEWKPVWTDLNDNDPGITLTQVFAWLSEMLLYRMNRIPELNYYKFLQLLGIELNAAAAASAEITFPVKETHAQPYVIVPARTQVSAEVTDGGAPLIFETERALTALTAQLASLQVFDSYSFSPVTTENEEATEGFEPFGKLARDDSALLLGFSSKSEFPARIELNLAFWVTDSNKKAVAFQCGASDAAAFGPAVICWEYWDGGNWLKMDLLKDETRALTRSGHVYLKTPPKGKMQKAVIGSEAEELFWIQARVTRSQYERAPELLAVRANTVAARQAETLKDEVLGGSDGRRDQGLDLSRSPVLKNTLALEVDEGEGFKEWREVEDFFGSSAADPHYVLDRTSGRIRFGDGEFGGIPVKYAANPSANVVAREYRVGGGKRGNVAAKTIKNLVTAVDGVDGSAIYNLLAASGGREEELLAEAKKRVPGFLKSRSRAVTAEDFEYFAMQAAEIKRARALPLFHPDFPDVKVPGVVTVIVVPDSDSATPIPSEGTLRAVCAYLDERRLLTTELFVMKPTYQKVEIRSEILVKDSADIADVKTSIEKTLETYFDALKGGEDGLGWPFGGTISYSRVFHRVFSVDGVDSIQSLTITLDGVEADKFQDIEIKTGALLFSGQHEIQVSFLMEASGE